MVFPEGEHDKVLRAAKILVDRERSQPRLLPWVVLAIVIRAWVSLTVVLIGFGDLWLDGAISDA